jgi:hypothetical protein
MSSPSEPVSRRGFVKAALLSVFAVVADGAAGLAAAQETPPEEPLPRRLVIGEPDIPPLDSPVVFAREGAHEQGMTHEVFSLIQEEKGSNAFPWTVYAQLRTQHTAGDAVVFYSRLYKDGPGWSCGFHSEVFAKNWGVALGANIEMSNQYEGTEGFNGVIGLEMQSLGPKPARSGIQIEGAGGYEALVRLTADGQTGIDCAGNYGVGVNLGRNPLRLAEGSWIQLDADGQVKLRYNRGNIEFFNGDRRVAHLAMDAQDHAL